MTACHRSSLNLQVGKGVLRSIRLDYNKPVDLIPVDIAVNTMISAAWYTAVVKTKQNIQIYQITSGSTNPVYWRTVGTGFHILTHQSNRARSPMHAA